MCVCVCVFFFFFSFFLVFHLEIIKRLLVWVGYLTTCSIIYQSNGYTYYILSLKSAGKLGKVFGKNSIIIPILKQGKPRNNINIDRLLSHLIFSRISYFCEKNNVIPVSRF